MSRQKWMQACCCVLLLTIWSVQPVQAMNLSQAPEESLVAVTQSQAKSVSKPKKAAAPNPKTKSGSQGENQEAELPKISADAAVLMDAVTGDVLIDKQAHTHRPPASTTKIMTAILGLELGRPDEVVTVSSKAAAVGESTIHLDPGEKATLYELITGALIKSGNDACVAIGEQIAGSEEQFVRMMNQKALSLGATDTHFENTNGLPNKNHYSTAYDLALIARYGMGLPSFSSITRQKETEIHFLEPDFMMDLRNTNKLLWNYPYADGVKTGTTNAAGKCLVASATKDGRQLIAVVLHASDRFGDAQRMLEWGFNQTETVSVVKAGEAVAEFSLDNDEPLKALAEHSLDVSITKSDHPKIEKKINWIKSNLPIQAGEELGTFEVWLNGKKINSVPLLAEREVKAPSRFFRKS
ncbi:D-alanyl-D-alanine carboxypeptidase family protein [Desulfitobacterium sp. AusDCA]|uniref:D-alanyl-D-alanine carboxypeptidase family protein n=1 Tax=Desulfitobacterium sp. AusDCA TaxID=3240383 RepID=UPI003DA74B10